MEMYKNQGVSTELNVKIRKMMESLQAHNIKVSVYTLPWEYQVREKRQGILFPQRLVASVLEANDIAYFDFTEVFQNYVTKNNLRSSALYLFGDPVHLSSISHKVVAEHILTKNRLLLYKRRIRGLE